MFSVCKCVSSSAMCECLRGIFRATCTTSSNADSDREDSHGNPEARDSPVNDKRRSPPSDRPPFGPPHHNLATDEQDSPERIVQKEKLHAELKQVLSQKRNQQRDTHSTLIDMEEPPKKDSQNEVEKDCQLSELVEVVVETQAEVGASGYSVVGGGDRGIFIKEVLKDSPAAKHLSLQKGDQLLSARVYFDNVKYEDALQILQCAEPYKVSFFLKRTVQGSEISICPGGQNLELRGRKAKMQRMSVKSVKPFKAKKKRGGRFGLKRLKENIKARAQAELDIESSSGRSDLSPVDIEFVFPKFKMRKGGKATSDGSGQLEGVITTSRKKKKIRFLRMKATDAAEGEGNINVDVSTHEGEAEVSGAKPKAKVKGPKFGIHFPKTKKSKLDVQSSNDNFEVKEPMVETDFSMAQDNAEANVPNVEVSVKGKGEGPEKKMPRMNLDVSNTMPNVKLPNLRLSCHSDETDGEASMKIDTSENKLKMPMTDIKAQTKVNLDLHLPKTKGTVEIKDVEIHDPNVKGTKISMVNFGTSLTKLNLDVNQKIGDDVDGSMVKQHEISLPKLDLAVPKIETSDMNISLPTSDHSLLKMTAKNTDSEALGSTGKKCEMPKLDISLPKITSPESEIIVEEPAAKGKIFNMPSVDISLSKGKLEGSSVHEGDAGKRGMFEMPQMDISLSTIKLPEVKTAKEEPEVKTVKLNLPNVNIPLTKGKVEGKGEIEGPFVKGPEFIVPQISISLPKTKLPQGKIDIEEPEIKGGKFSMPCIDIFLPKGTLEGDVNIEGHSEKGGKSSVDVSQSNMKLPEGDITEEPEIKAGTFNVPSIEISLPKGKAEEHVEVGDLSEKEGKFKMPHVAVLLPKLKFSTGKINTEDPEVQGEKFKMPSVDIYLPKGKAEFEGHSGKSETFDIPKIYLSLPKMSLPESDISIEGPDEKRFSMPSVYLPSPKVTGTSDVDIKRHSEKTGKFDMLKQDFSLPKIESTKGELNVEGSEKFEKSEMYVSLPKFKSPGGKINIEGPDIKGKKFHMPSVDNSLPRGGPGGDVDAEEHAAKGRKLELPKFDVSLHKLKGEVDVEGPDIKGGMFHIPAADISLPGGGASVDVDVEGHETKGRKFEMPKLNVSMPKFKTTGGEIDVEGPDLKDGKFHMPSIDISLPGRGACGGVDVEGHAEKGRTFEMPKIDVSLPKFKSPGGEINVEGPDIKGKKFHIPSVDIAQSRGGAGGDIDAEGHAGKGRKFEMPKFYVSMPKLKSVVKVEGTDIKGGTLHMPSLDISLPGTAGGDVDVEGHTGKERKFNMPKFDISLPKFKTSGGEIDIEGPDLKGGKFCMPSVDVSQPGVGAGGDLNVEGHARKGRKFEVPKFDVSMPKFKTSVGEVNVEGPDIRGRKFHMPSVDISLPVEGAVGDLNVVGHARKGKFEMLKFDISLPAIDISSPKGKGGGDFDLDLDRKGWKFNLPSIDISLPKVKMEGDIAVESSNTQGGHFEIPKLDISLPKIPSSECDVKADNPDVKGDKLHMPFIDISLPKMKQERDMTVEGQARKGVMFQMSSVDISLPEGTKEGGLDLDDDIEKDGKFHMPTYNISLPKMKLTEHELKVESTDKKARKLHMPFIDISLPKMTNHSNVEAKATGGSITDLNYPEVTPGGNIKLPTVKIPMVDISAPKFDLDFTLQKGKGSDKENIELLKAEGGRPSSGDSFDVPEVSVKMPKMSLPKFGKKLKSGGKELESPLDLDMERRSTSMETDGKIKKAKIKIPSIGISKMNVDMSGTEAEIKIKNVAEEITKPEIQVESPDDEVKHKLKFKTSSPKAKLKYAEMDMSLHTNARERGNFKTPTLDNKGKVKMPAVEISLPTTNMTDCEVLLPKSEVDVSEEDIQGYEGNLKIPKMPTIDISFPKFSLPKVKLNESADSNSSDLNIDSSMGTVNFPHIKIPKVDISLPRGKTGDMDSLEVDFKGGKFKLPKITTPTVDKSVPSGKTRENCPPELEIRGGRHFNMSEVKISNADTSLPLETTGGLDDPKLEVRGYGSIFKKLDIKMPDVDISLPKGKIGEINVPEKEMKGKREKFQMPKVDIVVPRIRSSDSDVPELELRRQLKMPAVEISLPHAKTDTSKHDVETKGDNLKMPNISKPTVDISLPLRNTGESDDLDSEFRVIGGKFKMPDITMPKVDLSLSHGWKRESHKPDSEVDSGKLKTPTADISHPKIKSKDTVAQETQAGEEKGKVTIPGIKLPTVDILLPHCKKGDTNIKMPKVSLSHEKTGDNETPEQELEVKEGKFKVPDINVPKVDKSLLQRQQEDTEETETTKQGDNFQLPKIAIPTVDLSLPHSKTSDLEALESVAVGGGQCTIKIPKVDITLSQDTIGESDTKKAAIGEESGKFMIPNVKIPKLDISIPQGISKEANISVPATETVHKVTDSHKVGKKFRIPTICIEGPKGGLEINLGLSKEGKKNKKKIELPDIDLRNDAPKGRMKRPKVKGSKFNIGMPKVKSAGLKTDLNKSGKEDAREGTDVNLTVDLQGLKIPNVEISSPTIKQGGIDIKVPEKCAFTKPINTDVSSKREHKLSNIEITTPKFPELDIDNRTAQVGTDNAEEDKKQVGKAKIPKFGIPLPSLCSPEANIKSSQVKCNSVTVDSEIEYEGPPMPKVQKAVFVMVNPQMVSSASLGGKASAGIGDEKLPKIKMKKSFGKSRSNEKGKSINGKDDVETEGKPKTGKLMLPKVTFSSWKTVSFDVKQGGSDDGKGLNLNGDKDEKAMFGKLKLPKVEFFSPYSKEIDEEEDMETSMKLLRTETSGNGKEIKEAKTKSGKMSCPGEKKKTGMDEEMGEIGALVSSKARTEMLAEWERSESPIPTVSAGFISGKKSKEREETTWIKVPKVTLSSHSTGSLQITPEGSPRRSKSSLPCSSDEASGGFYVKMPSIEFSTQKMSSENIVTETKEGTLTVVKKVTKYTESRSSSSKQ
ncbi:neuroblast differentiation-associated protein AHNAK-like [Xyrauchen texanus]|uniref:neuroblast differentiation-associated protein AHNAK-like n=1 Tax=Xyrauchen texanus TaxID=154827 RepID=UPI002241C13D|nr:neuroblast differentiation-associated protein AHNAK-like [Xyrauchen texanus]